MQLKCSQTQKRSKDIGKVSNQWVINDRIFILEWTIPCAEEAGLE